MAKLSKPLLTEKDYDSLATIKLRFSYRVIKQQLNERAGLSARSKKKNPAQPNATEDVGSLLKILKKLGY